MGATYALQNVGDIFVTSCSECGVTYGISEAYADRRRNDHQSWVCPNGHSQVFVGKSADKKRIEELEAQVRREQSARESAERSRKWAETQTKGANIKAGKARAAHRRLLHRTECGVCPHCQRTFKQLAAHMKTKHGT